MNIQKTEGGASLPKGWLWTRIGDIIEKISLTGKKLKQSEYQKEGRLRVIDQGHAFIGGYTDKEELKISCEMPLVVFGDHTKVAKYVDFDFVAGADGVKVIKPLEVFCPKLFYYFLQTVALPDKGYARHFQFLEKSSVPLPPLPEQRRIVAKIEELFTRLDAGVGALKKVKAQLKHYRQAVLKHAFEGRLTEEWREVHKDELEPASVLLEKIQQERGKKKNIGAIHESPLQNHLPELPEGWVSTRVGNISEMMQYGTSEKAINDTSGIPVLRMGNIQNGKLTYKALKYFPPNWSLFEAFLLKDGDVLFNRTNSAELVGKTAVYKKHHPLAVFASYLIRVKVNSRAYNPDLLAFFINSSYGRQYMASVVSQQVGQANVNSKKLSLMPIPLPPLTEQSKIVEQIEGWFSVADAIEGAIDHSLKHAERLRQSILKRAFGGKLVPQDPTDEPASVLLERIQAEKAKLEAKQKMKKGRKKKANTEQMRFL